jgi:hypothetical protein
VSLGGDEHAQAIREACYQSIQNHSVDIDFQSLGHRL